MQSHFPAFDPFTIADGDNVLKSTVALHDRQRIPSSLHVRQRIGHS